MTADDIIDGEFIERQQPYEPTDCDVALAILHERKERSRDLGLPCNVAKRQSACSSCFAQDRTEPRSRREQRLTCLEDTRLGDGLALSQAFQAP